MIDKIYEMVCIIIPCGFPLIGLCLGVIVMRIIQRGY